jgi:hypothetical protein
MQVHTMLPVTAKAAKLQDLSDAKLCQLDNWTIVGTTTAGPLQIYFREMDLLEEMDLLRQVIFTKFRMLRPWRTTQQDPLQILQSLTVYVKYSDRTKDHYRLNIVLQTGRKNKCTVVPYVAASEASHKPRTYMLHRAVRLLADHLKRQAAAEASKRAGAPRVTRA